MIQSDEILKIVRKHNQRVWIPVVTGCAFAFIGFAFLDQELGGLLEIGVNLSVLIGGLCIGYALGMSNSSIDVGLRIMELKEENSDAS